MPIAIQLFQEPADDNPVSIFFCLFYFDSISVGYSK